MSSAEQQAPPQRSPAPLCLLVLLLGLAALGGAGFWYLSSRRTRYGVDQETSTSGPFQTYKLQIYVVGTERRSPWI